MVNKACTAPSGDITMLMQLIYLHPVDTQHAHGHIINYAKFTQQQNEENLLENSSSSSSALASAANSAGVFFFLPNFPGASSCGANGSGSGSAFLIPYCNEII